MTRASSLPRSSTPSRRQVPLIALRGVACGPRPDGGTTLDDVTLAIDEGGQTAIVGACADDEAALFALLQRHRAPRDGAIMLDGRDLASIPDAELAQTVAAVEREPPAFTGTLRDHLAAARPGASGGELAAAVAEARLEGLLVRLPDGLDSELAERDGALCGGERQRIALARALLGRPRILLLDEAPARLDAPAEHALRAALARVARRCTVLVIPHRLATVLAADRVVVLYAGRVRAVGAHAELMASDPRYRELVATRLIATGAG